MTLQISIQSLSDGFIFTRVANKTAIVFNRFPHEGADVGNKGITQTCTTQENFWNITFRTIKCISTNGRWSSMIHSFQAFHISQVNCTEDSPSYIGFTEVSTAKVSFAEIGTNKVSANEASFGQLGSAEVSITEDGSGEGGSPERGSSEESSSEISPFEVSFFEIGRFESGSNKIGFPQISSEK